jgi:peptidoglycan endopeptidase LytF
MGRGKRIPKSVFLMALGALLWTSLSLAQTGQTQGTYMTTATVNVRKGPGTDYETVAKIPKGARVQVVGKQGSWLKVQSKHGNPPGYIDERFAVPRKEKAAPAPASPGTYTTTATVNVRKGPGTSHAIVAKIPKNSKVQVVGFEGDWLKVQSKHGNPPGYIQKTYAKRLAGS